MDKKRFCFITLSSISAKNCGKDDESDVNYVAT